MGARDLVINGKFASAGFNGVHRVAARLSRDLHATTPASTGISLFTPNASAIRHDVGSIDIREVRGWFGHGQGWEMMTLPRAARNSVLLNLCNLAPVLHPRSVVMIHDAQTYLFPQDYSGRQAAGYRALLPIIGSRAAKVITVSEYSKARLVEHRIAAADKIDVIHNGSDHILDEPADPSVLAKHALEQGGYVLVIGTTKRYKNISTVFRALEDTGLRLVVAGGPGNAQSYLELGIKPPESTLFTGFVSDAELRSLYSHAGVFCLPSLTEGFGLPAVEAMQCGCPVIASNAGAMPEICGDAAILVSAENSGEWREAIKAVLGEPARADDLRKAGYDRAAAFQWERAAQQLWSSLEPLL